MDVIDGLRQIIARFDEEDVDYALCGGLAMAVYAMPRATLDIDLMVQETSLDQTSRVLEPLEFVPIGAPMEFCGGKVKISRFRRIDRQTGDVLVLDLLHVTADTTAAWESRCDIEWEGRRLRVLSPRGLILLKELRRSGQDQDDLAYLRSITDEG